MEQASLFRRRPIRRGYMVLMFVGSLLIHGSLVGVSALFWQPISQPIEVPVSQVDLTGDPDVRELIVPFDAPTPPPDMPTPPPEETPPPEDTPPPTDPEMDEPDAPTPTPKPKTEQKPHYATPAPANAKRGPVPQTGVVGGNPNGTKAFGTPGPAKVAGTWKTPHPPYPAAARAAHVTGTTTVSYTTDASGNISSVTITQRAGNAILDHQTESFVRSNWHGPPNSRGSTTFEYRLQ